MEVFMNTCFAPIPALLDMVSFPNTSDIGPLIIVLIFLGSLGLIIAAVFLLNYFFNKKK